MKTRMCNTAVIVTFNFVYCMSDIIKRVSSWHVVNASLVCFDLWPSLPLAAAVSSPQPLPCAAAPSSSAPPSSALAPRRSARAAAAHGAPFHAAPQTALHTHITVRYCLFWSTLILVDKLIISFLLYVFPFLSAFACCQTHNPDMIPPKQHCSAFVLIANQSLDVLL